MALFRQRINVEAWQFEAPKFMPQPKWLSDALVAGKIYFQGGDTPYYTIQTLDGKRRAHPGDWIVRYPMGAIDTLPNDVFAATFEAVQ